MKLLILGGNKFLGRELVKQAIEHHDVTVIALDKPKADVKWIKLNRHDEIGLKAVFNTHYDAVIDNIAYTERDVLTLLNASQGRLKRYVLTSSVDIYNNTQLRQCREYEHQKLTPFATGDEKPPYNVGKRSCEIALRGSLVDIEKVVIRPAIVVGKYDNVLMHGCQYSRSLFYPIRIDQQPIMLFSHDYRPYQTVFVEDAARGLLLAATANDAAGVYNLASPTIWTNERLIRELEAAVNQKPTEILRIPYHIVAEQLKITYSAPYITTDKTVNPWALFDTTRIEDLGWKATDPALWLPKLFDEELISKYQTDNARNRALEVSACKSNLVAKPIVITHEAIAPTAIGIGTHRGSATDEDDFAYEEALTYALEHGITVIDTAINYRDERSERVVGKVTSKLSAYLISKGGFAPTSLYRELLVAELNRKHSIRAEYIDISLAKSLSNLKRPIDCYMLHNPELGRLVFSEDDFYKELTKTFALLEQRVKDGVIKCYGLATWHGLRVDSQNSAYLDLERALSCASLAAGTVNHNLKAIEFPFNIATAEAELEHTQHIADELISTFELAKRRGLLTFSSFSIKHGMLDVNVLEKLNNLKYNSSSAAKMLYATMNHPQLSCALIGTKNIEHVKEAVNVLQAKPLSKSAFKRLLKPIA